MTSNTSSNLPLVSITGSPTFVTEASGTPEVVTIRLSQPAPVDGLKLNLVSFDSDATDGDETVTTLNLSNIVSTPLNNGKGSVITSVKVAAGATEASLILTPNTDNLIEGPESNFFYLLPGDGYTVNPSLSFATTTLLDSSNVVPVVSVNATPSTVEEGSQLKWNFNLTQPAPTGGLTVEFALTEDTDPLPGDIEYNVTGSSNITSFELLRDSAGVITGAKVGIAAGATSATLLNNVIADGLLEGPESVTYTLINGDLYEVNPTTNAAKFTLADTSTSLTYVVNSNADVVDANDGVLTLREAINTANAKPGADKIEIDAGVTFNAALGTLRITDDLQITGGSILGGSSSPVVDIFTVDNGAKVTIENVYIANSTDDAIQVNNGSLTLSNSTLENNADDGIDFNSSNGKLTVSSVLIQNNGVPEVASFGSGIEIDGSNNQISVTDVTIIGSESNAISVDDGASNQITVSRVAFTNNGGSSVAIGLNNPAAVGNILTVSDASFTSNAFDGIFVGSNNNFLDISRIAFNNNISDGIDIDGNSNSVILQDATLAGNIGTGFEIGGLNNAVQISRIASINNGSKGIGLDATANNNIVTVVESTLANNGEGNLANTGSNNSVGIINVAGVPNSTGTVRLAIANPSFENPVLPNVQDSSEGYFTSSLEGDVIPGWQVYDPNRLITGIPVTPGGTDFTDAGVYNATGFYFNDATDGTNVGFGFISDAPGSGVVGLQQTLNATFNPNNRYTLLVNVGNTGNNPTDPIDFTGFPGYRFELLAGDEVVDYTTNPVSVPEGEFSQVAFSIFQPGATALAGKSLGVRLINLNESSGLEVDFDNVQLSTESPLAGSFI